MSSISPNMQLVLPTVAQTPGPQWASELNSSLTLVDQHDHTPGKGVPITPAGISINSDLTFSNNNATNIRSSRYSPQPSALALPTDIGAVYVAGADLYYNDTAGNQIRLTQGGSIVGTAGSITGLPSGTASASYAGGTFTWQAATNTPATMDNGSVTIREDVLNGNGVTLKAVNALSSNYDLFLPALPASQKIMTLDSSGNITAPYSVDGSTIVVASNIIKVPNGGITNDQLSTNSVNTNNIIDLAVTAAKLATNSVTNSKIGAGEVTPDKLSAAVVGISGLFTSITTTTAAMCSISGSNRPLVFIVLAEATGVTSGEPTLTSSSSTQPLLIGTSSGPSDYTTIFTTNGTSATPFNTGIYVRSTGVSGSTGFYMRTGTGNLSAGSGWGFRLVVVQL